MNKKKIRKPFESINLIFFSFIVAGERRRRKKSGLISKKYNLNQSSPIG